MSKAKQAVLGYLSVTGDILDSCELAGVASQTYYNWRSRDSTFKALSDNAIEVAKQTTASQTLIKDVFDPEKVKSVRPPFNDFRMRIIGRPTPPHAQPIVDAWADETNLIVIVLAPPGAGKDTIAGDLTLYESVPRDQRVTWVMESANFSERRLTRLERYFWDRKVYDIAPVGPGCQKPESTLMDDYGLFKWRKGLKYADGQRVGSPKWTKTELFFLGRDNEADPNVWGTGIEGAMYGSRIDRAFLSDIFTAENQLSPATRDKQWSWLFGTFMTRLDEGGRAMFLGTRVGAWDNWGRLLDEMVTGAPIVHQDGYYTKYGNGVATVIFPAIQTDESGEDASYWPERFPLKSYLVKGDQRVEVGPTTHQTEAGWRRIRGLYEIRDRNVDLFETMYQQNPSTDDQGEFSQTLLDHCDDPSRTYGVVKAGEILVLGIDPARTGGASWMMWAYDGEKITLVDEFYGENIGTHGLREKLLVDPIMRYLPRYAVYEGNRESSVLEHPQVIDAVKVTKTQLTTHNTNSQNRSVGELRVAAMSLDMAAGIIRFPASTPPDRIRSSRVKEHFRNWDQKQQIRQLTGNIRQSIPDDRAMAAWVGWVKIKELGGTRKMRPKGRRVAGRVARHWNEMRAGDNEKPEVPSDLVSFYYQTGGD